MLIEKPSPQPKPKLTDAEVHVLRSYLRTVVFARHVVERARSSAATGPGDV